MVLCSCGQFTEEGTTLCPRCEALHLLGLGVEALDNDVRSAYRLQSKAWQPENFADDANLKDSAEAKLKDIQSAYEFLTMTSTDRGHVHRPVYLSAKPATAATAANPVSDAQAASSGNPSPAPPQAAPAPASAATPPPQPSQTHQTPENLWQKYKIPIIALAGVVALAFLLLIWTATSAHDSSGDQAVRKKPMNPLIALLAQVLNAIDPQPSAPAPQSSTLPPQTSAPEANPPSEQLAPADAKNTGDNRATAHGAQPAAPHGAQPAASRNAQTATAHGAQLEGLKLKRYITVGSTRAEVIALEGAPTASSEDKLVYGRSELILKDGAVLRWRIDRAASPLPVKLWPRVYVDPYLDFFTVGSSKDEVLKVQGTPTAFTEDQFEYDRSIVYFSNNRVVRWKSASDSVMLWAR